MSRTPRGGRHRLGPPDLRHCRDFPTVKARLDGTEPLTRHASGTGAWRIRPALAVTAGLLAALVSGWLTAGDALAQQLTGH